MSERIHEVLLVTRNADGTPHLAPMGLRRRDNLWLLAPFRPSRTLDNLLRQGHASINTTDDVRIYAGCLTGRHNWSIRPCDKIDADRLDGVLCHCEIELDHIEDDSQRPHLYCRELHRVNHRPFLGYNRAQAAVLELAILVSRLRMLPAEKVDTEIAYLQIAIDKTAGAEERQAWNWLMQRVDDHRASTDARSAPGGDARTVCA